MVNPFLFLSFGTIYPAKNSMRPAELKFFAFLREEIDDPECDVFRSAKLIVIEQQASEFFQTKRLFHRVPELFANFQRFLRLLYSFSGEP